MAVSDLNKKPRTQDFLSQDVILKLSEGKARLQARNSYLKITVDKALSGKSS
jgi:hypothetical protein